MSSCQALCLQFGPLPPEVSAKLPTAMSNRYTGKSQVSATLHSGSSLGSGLTVCQNSKVSCAPETDYWTLVHSLTPSRSQPTFIPTRNQ